MAHIYQYSVAMNLQFGNTFAGGSTSRLGALMHSEMQISQHSTAQTHVRDPFRNPLGNSTFPDLEIRNIIHQKDIYI
jgi:hypothetical protein